MYESGRWLRGNIFPSSVQSKTPIRDGSQSNIRNDFLGTLLVLCEASQQIRHQSNGLFKVTEPMMAHRQKTQSCDSMPSAYLWFQNNNKPWNFSQCCSCLGSTQASSSWSGRRRPYGTHCRVSPGTPWKMEGHPGFQNTRWCSQGWGSKYNECLLISSSESGEMLCEPCFIIGVRMLGTSSNPVCHVDTVQSFYPVFFL